MVLVDFICDMFLPRLRLFFAFILLWISSYGVAQVGLVAKEGLLDAREHDFANQSLKLNGEWKFYWKEFLTPDQINGETIHAGKINFPSIWFSVLGGQGYATYQLTLLLKPNQEGYSIEMPAVYSAYSLWLNGKLVAKNGVVGSTRKAEQPQWLPKLINLPQGVEMVSIVLQISNFSHHKGGLKDPLILGLSKNLLGERRLAINVNALLVGVMMFVSLFFLNLYFFVKKEKLILYFSLLCFVWVVRLLFSDWYLAIQWMPSFNWELAVKIEYITIYLVMILAMLFVARLYPLDTNKVVKYLLVIPNALFVAVTIASDAVFYTKYLDVFLIFAGFVILYVIFIILRAIAFERYGAWFSVLGLFAAVAAFVYNILAYEELFDFNPILYYSAWLLIVIFMSVALAYQLSPNAKKYNTSETLSFEDFLKGH